MNYSQSKGKSLDNEIAASIHEITDDTVRANSRRGSGNTSTPAADLLVRTMKGDHEIELKRFSRPRPEDANTVSEASAYVERDVFEELHECSNAYTETWLGVLFTNCELLLLSVPDRRTIEVVIEDVAYNIVPDVFVPTVTDSYSLRLTKPRRGKWPSATKGRSPAVVVCEALGVDYDE